ncbi:beta-lactamase family protein [Ruania sp. N2-46]|uniref:Beta-lactamase family protein n=1 Tax=Occultella gossypii TaxID=2800820 RepID=A0ABS7S2M4_9MICO|nr:beta-lactamase family protein [Occultella gossypii]
MPALQEKVQGVLGELVDAGAETGLQVAVFHHGDLVVDAVAGVADSRTGRAVTADTPFFSFSSGKVMSSLIAHLLVSTGAVDYDTPVVDLWPEFGAHGKGTTTLRHVLTHSAGVPAMPRDIGPTDLPDWPRVCTAIADVVPRCRDGVSLVHLRLPRRRGRAPGHRSPDATTP